jgi:hypothetical protein
VGASLSFQRRRQYTRTEGAASRVGGLVFAWLLRREGVRRGILDAALHGWEAGSPRVGVCRRDYFRRYALTLRTSFLRLAALAAGALFAPMLHAQITATAPASVVGTLDNQRFDFEGGAAYSHFNPGYAHQVRAINLVGWEGGVTAWFNNRFGLEGTVRGLYGNYTLPNNDDNLPPTSDMSEYLFLFGPTVRLVEKDRYTAGMHLLIGGAYGTFDKGYDNANVQPFQIGVYNNQLAFAYAIGGWADYKVLPNWAVRFTADYQPTRYAGLTQNEFTGAVGIVYKFGHR